MGVAIRQLIERCSQRPTKPQDAMAYGCVRHDAAGQSQGPCERHILAVQFYCDVTAAIVRLLVVRGPLAILRRVRTVHVAALQRHAVRAAAHIGQEARKIFAPLRRHCDAAPAVVFVARVLGVVAAALGVFPGLVFAESFAPIWMVDRFSFALPAAATLDLAVHDRRPTLTRDTTALTATHPLIAVGLSMQNSQPMKHLSGEVYSGAH